MSSLHHSHNHSSSGGHDHGHAHTHAIPGEGVGRAFAIGIVINLAYVVAEAVFGILSGSMALLADAGHNLSDVLGLAIAWAGAHLSQTQPSKRFTYGLGGSSILAALVNGLLLLVAAGGIAWEALRRIADPQPVPGETVILVAAIGIVINLGTALLFVRGREDINIRGAFLHMAADAAVSAAVVVAGVLMILTGKMWIDPAASLIVVAVIVWSTWGLLRDALRMSLAGVPPGITLEDVLERLARLPGVTAVHDLHVWPMSTRDTALTAHLVMPGGHPGDDFLRETEAMLRADFGIVHATVQIEMTDEFCDAAAACTAPSTRIAAAE